MVSPKNVTDNSGDVFDILCMLVTIKCFGKPQESGAGKEDESDSGN